MIVLEVLEHSTSKVIAMKSSSNDMKTLVHGFFPRKHTRIGSRRMGFSGSAEDQVVVRASYHHSCQKNSQET